MHLTIPSLRAFACCSLLLAFTSGIVTGRAAEEPLQVRIEVDARQSRGELKPIWRFFGADEPNYATMPDGKKLLGQLGQLDPQAQVFFRAHNLLTSGDGTPALKWGSTGVYGEDGRGRPIYDWSIVDGIFDSYLKQGVRPFVEIGFMPEALSVHPFPYQHNWKPGVPSDLFTGWSYPPKDYAKWEELNYQWARHCGERYGVKEAESWWWEVWNEPNIGYWKGTPEEYHKLYDYAMAGVRRALPKARVGGPHSTSPRDAKAAQFLRNFLEHCLRGTNYATGQVGSPLDFIGFHAKGAPAFVDGHARMAIAPELQDLDAGFGIVAGFPELKHLPIIIGECDPDFCAACLVEKYPQYAYRNSALYASYTAAFSLRAHELAAKHGVNLEGTLTWAFEFENQPWFSGFRALAGNGVEMPVMNAFRMMAKMRGQRLAVISSQGRALGDILKQGVRAEPDVTAMASREGDTISVLVWNYHDDDVAGSDAEVNLAVDNLKGGADKLKLRHYRVDAEHGNAFTVWKKMGSPATPTAAQIEELQKSAALSEIESPAVELNGNSATVRFKVPRQAVSLLVFDGVK